LRAVGGIVISSLISDISTINQEDCVLRLRGILRLAFVVGVFAFGAGGGSALRAQDHGSAMSAPRQIVVSAHSEVDVAPDRAHLTIAVESRARTSQAASSENARVQTAVIEAVRRVGVEASHIRTQLVMVQPEYQYPREGGRPMVSGYVARNSVLVEIRDLSRIGGVIDAALTAGATNIQGPNFSLSNPDSARREALDGAVRKAMADAAVIARAADVRLGDLLELTSDDARGILPMVEARGVMGMRAEMAETPIEAGTIQVRASVRLRIAVTRQSSP